MANRAGLPRRIFRRTAEPLAADVSLIASEFLAGFQLVEQIDRPAVSIFGSARIREESPTYAQARATGRSRWIEADPTARLDVGSQRCPHLTEDPIS